MPLSLPCCSRPRPCPWQDDDTREATDIDISDPVTMVAFMLLILIMLLLLLLLLLLFIPVVDVAKLFDLGVGAAAGGGGIICCCWSG